MNAAARVLNESILWVSRSGHVRRIFFSKQMVLAFLLTLSILASLFSIITVADKNRIEVGILADLQQDQNKLTINYDQLLLEKNTWNAPLRIENIAEHRLNMAVPDPKKIQLIQR